jgi:hypothetical protein
MASQPGSIERTLIRHCSFVLLKERSLTLELLDVEQLLVVSNEWEREDPPPKASNHQNIPEKMTTSPTCSSSSKEDVSKFVQFNVGGVVHKVSRSLVLLLHEKLHVGQGSE